MEEMQEKLQQYRVRKRRKERFDKIKEKFKRFLMLGTGKGTPNNETTIDITHERENRSTDNQSSASAAEEDDLVISTDEEQHETQSIIETKNGNKTFEYILWTVYFLFWTTLYIIAIELKFGLVFLMLSALFGIYFNTRTAPKKRNEISAYSVFNKNCESIDGTLKAEQFEREIRYGAGSVK